jgi:formylglycine-generating enzyme required for sulfatase activity
MSKELAIQLHRLYSDYYAARLGFDDYRHRRGLLLDSLQAAYERPDEDDVTKPREVLARSEPVTATAIPAKQRSTVFRWYYVVPACLVLVVAVVFAVTRQLDEEALKPVTPAAQQADAEPLAPANVEPENARPAIVHPPDVGQELVEDFIARADWRAMSIIEFEDSWKRLPESDRIVAKGAIWFAPLAENLAYKIDEAMEFSTKPTDDEQLDRLYELSLYLGLVELVPPGWMPDPDSRNRHTAQAGSEPLVDEANVVEVPGGDSAEVAAVDDEPTEDLNAVAATAVTQDGGCSVAQLQTRRRTCFDVLQDGSQGPPMRVLAAGDFVMGSPANPEEDPQRTVMIAEPFAMSIFEITWADFKSYCQAAGVQCPAQPWSEDDLPVVNVSWHDAAAYAEWLSRQTGQTYRLPTEEEWEYAARGGTTTEYPYGDKLLPAQARFSSIAPYTSPLPTSDRTTQRNEFGLWHVVGNVREWVDAEWPASQETAITRVIRGGSYAGGELDLRFAARTRMPPDAKDNKTGFRLLREL